MALGIDKNLYGTDICSDESKLFIDYSPPLAFKAIKRINVDYAGEAAEYPYRFIAVGNKYVSK